MNQSLFLIAGEKSGDMLGGNLLKALKEQFPDHSYMGVGGQEMRQEGFECILRTEDFEMHGFSDILGSLPKLRRQFKEIRKKILTEQPEAVIFIDYPGFNLRMAKSLRKHGYKGKLVQYVCPTIWAWGAKRKEQMEETLDLVLSIYPFETSYFKNSPLKVEYVGNPVKSIVESHKYDDSWPALFGIKKTENLIALFPGSRKGEIQRNLPYQLKTCELLKKENPNLVFAISCAHEKIMPVMHPMLRNVSLKLHQDLFLLPRTYSYELMRDCRSALAKSGTVTLELALHQKPAVVLYKLSRFNRFIARYILRLKLPHYCIVNILSNKTVYPEIIEKGLSAQNLYKQFKPLNDNTEERRLCIEQCQDLNQILQEKDASQQAAVAVRELIG
jgi:lipid-A-disaccharide synthase